MTVTELVSQLNKLTRRNRKVLLQFNGKSVPLDNIQYNIIADEIILVAKIQEEA